MTLPNQPSLEQRILDLESAVRQMRATNQTDRISVVNAAGQSVPLGQLAFGQVAWAWTQAQLDAGQDGFAINGAANASGGTGWIAASGGAITPSLDVFVAGSKLRVDMSAAMTVFGRGATFSLSYALVGPAASQAALASAPTIFNGDTLRALQVRANLVNSAWNGISAGTMVLETGLAPGWYRVIARYNLTYASDPSVPQGTINNPRFALTPY